jgi:hypothetical protein
MATELLPIGAINEALNLVHRFREGDTFRHHVEQRLRLVVPMVCLMALVGVACSAGVMLFLGDIHRSLVLVAIVLLPVILVGSLFVQAYVFFSWLESRALAHRGGPVPLPPVPWGMAALLLFAPLLMLALVAWKAALVLVALAALAPLLYALADR